MEAGQHVQPSQTPEAMLDGLAIPAALVFPIVVAAVAGILIATSDGQLPRPQFYEIAATVIPVLVVAFAVEDRAGRLFKGRRMWIYRAQLFLFLLGGELFAFLGLSGVLRHDARDFALGAVAESQFWNNAIAGGTAAGLIGGFLMIAVLAVGGPGVLIVSRPRLSDDSDELGTLRQRIAALEAAAKESRS
jgi:hypothetical protein